MLLTDKFTSYKYPIIYSIDYTDEVYDISCDFRHDQSIPYFVFGYDNCSRLLEKHTTAIRKLIKDIASKKDKNNRDTRIPDNDYLTFFKNRQYHKIIGFLPTEYYLELAEQLVILENIGDISTTPGEFGVKLNKSNIYRKHKPRIEHYTNLFMKTKNILASISSRPTLSKNKLISLNKYHHLFSLTQKDTHIKYINPIEYFIQSHWEDICRELISKDIIHKCKRCKSLFDNKRYYSYIKEIGRGSDYKRIHGFHRKDRNEISDKQWEQKRFCRLQCRK